MGKIGPILIKAGTSSVRPGEEKKTTKPCHDVRPGVQFFAKNEQIIGTTPGA